LAHCGQGYVHSAILLNAADFTKNALRAQARHAGTPFQMINVTSRENAVFDLLSERALGRGLDGPHALTLRLDHLDDRSALASLGFAVPPPDRSICHWSTYLRPGTGAIYRALLDGTLRPDVLRAALHAARRDGAEPQTDFDAQVA
jgi:hypothetical protein